MRTKLKERLIGMIGVRKFIALTLTFVFSYLAIAGIVGKEEFLPVFSMVIGYYFGRSTALDKGHYSEEKAQG